MFEVKAECDRNFEALTRRLLDARPLVRVAIASHNLRSVAHAIAYNRARGRRGRDLELQVLRGLGDELAEALAEQRAAGAHLLPGRRPGGRHGLPGAAAAGEHGQRLVPRRAAARRADRGAAGGAVSFANEPVLELRRGPVRESLTAALRGARRPAAALAVPVLVGGERGDRGGLDSTDPAARAWWRGPGAGRPRMRGPRSRPPSAGSASGRARRPSGAGCCAARRRPARAPARAGRAAGARVRQAVGRGRRRRVRGDRLPRVLRARARSSWSGARAAAGAGRAQHHALRAARRGRRDRAVELPAGDPDGHDGGRAGGRQRGGAQAGRAVAGQRARARGGAARRRRAARRAGAAARLRRGGRGAGARPAACT